MNTVYNKVLGLCAITALAWLPLAGAEPAADDSSLDSFREQVEMAFPDVAWASDLEPVEEVVVAESNPEPEPVEEAAEAESVESIPSVAVFVRNQSRRSDLNEEMDALRSQLAAELSLHDLAVIDPTDLMDRFRQNRLPGDPDMRDMVAGLSPGGTTVRVAEMVDADFVVLLSIVSADVRQNVTTGDAIDTFTMRFAVRVLDGVQGRSVFGETFQRRHPRRGGTTGDVGIYFRDLIDRALPDVAVAVAESRSAWLDVDRPTALAQFSVRTNLDHFIDGLEHGVRGPVEDLDEVRRLVGGTTVLLNGAAIGSTPGTFEATPGLHNLRIEREWMAPYEVAVNIRDGMELNVALELSDAGLQRFASLEGVRAALALQYAEAAFRRGIRVNFDTESWQSVVLGDAGQNADVNINFRDAR